MRKVYYGRFVDFMPVTSGCGGLIGGHIYAIYHDFIFEDAYSSVGDLPYYMICKGLDFSYTNVNFDPQEFTEPIIMNLEGVDLRHKDFTGVEKFFVHCNLRGTGANISPSINPTVSPYIVSSTSKTK